MFRQHPLAEWVNLTERDRLESARALQAKVETADSSEQGQDAQFAHPNPRTQREDIEGWVSR